MNMQNFQAQYISCLNSSIDLLKDAPFSIKDLERIRSGLEETSFFVPIMGAFSSGKSSLLNELIGESILAVGIAPETEVATELHYSATPYIVAVKQDQTIQRFELNQLELVQQQAKDWVAIKLYLNNSTLNLLAPLVLVDMPGFGSANDSNQTAAADYIKKSIRTFVLVSAEHGTISKLLMEQLEQIKSLKTDFSVILSKCNLKAPSEIDELSTYIKTELADTFGTLDGQLVAMVGLDDVSTQLIPILNQIDPDGFIKKSYLPAMQDANDEILSLISFHKSGLDKNQNDFEGDIKSIKKDISTLKSSEINLKNDIDLILSRQFIDNRVSQVDHQLRENRLTIAKDFISHHCQLSYLSKSIVSIVKSTLLEKIEEQINTLGNEFLQQHTSQLLNIELDFIHTKIISSEKNHQQGIVSIIYQCIEKIIASIRKILPAFLSDLVSDYQEQQINIKLEQDIFPEIKAILQQHLGQLLAQQLNTLGSQISESILHQLQQKQTLLEKLQHTKSQADADVQQEHDRMTNLETNLYNISKDVLYKY